MSRAPHTRRTRGRWAWMACVAAALGGATTFAVLPGTGSAVSRHPLPSSGVYTGSSSQHELVTWRLTRHATEAEGFVRVYVNCAGRAYPTIDVMFSHSPPPPLRVSRQGRVHDSGSLPLDNPDPAGNGLSQLKIRLDGRFGMRTASGEVRITGSFRLADGTSLSCDSGGVRWRTRRDGTLGGGTSEFAPITLRLARGGRSVSRMAVDFTAPCSAGEAPASWVFRDLPVSGAGRFRRHVLAGRARTTHGTILEGEYTLQGQLRGKIARGTFRASGVVATPGQPIDSCDTGLLRWKVRGE